MYRELKLRSAILASGQLKLLPKERLYNNFGGIWNLSSDQGNLGTFLVTNVRLIWYADINDTFNISLPYIQIDNVSPRSALSNYVPEMHFFIFIPQIKIRDSKYGPALVVQTLETGGGYTLGFRVDPTTRLVEVYKELESLFSLFLVKPVFGVTFERKNVCTHFSSAFLSTQPSAKLKSSRSGGRRGGTNGSLSFPPTGDAAIGCRRDFHR